MEGVRQMDDMDHRWDGISIHDSKTNSPDIYRVTFKQLGRQNLRRMPGQPHPRTRPPDVLVRVRWSDGIGTVEEFKQEGEVTGFSQLDFEIEALKRMKATMLA